jgi:hypothetical protein
MLRTSVGLAALAALSFTALPPSAAARPGGLDTAVDACTARLVTFDNVAPAAIEIRSARRIGTRIVVTGQFTRGSPELATFVCRVRAVGVLWGDADSMDIFWR